MTDFDRQLEERLLRYTRISTQSNETSDTVPSTAVQLDLLRPLADELRQIGAQDVEITSYGVVLATVPSTVDHKVATIGFLAHVDTAPDFSAVDVKPVVHRNYDGGEIRFVDAPDLVLSPAGSPYLGERIGDTIVTASGKTLLGADDKSGVAIIMTMAEHLLRNPSVLHGPIRIAFTPDEEIGRGVQPELVGDFGADFAYTLDGDRRGVVEFESFSADAATVSVTGVSIHPGTAKGKLVNALYLCSKIVAALPKDEMTPETTEGRAGFIHLYQMNGGAAQAEMKFILRDFELDKLAAFGAMVQQACDCVQAGEPRAKITCVIRPQYRNMRYWLEKDMTPVELALAACRDCGIAPISHAIRGGTDGSRLTEFGTPCPNIFTGMQDIHGPKEWISVQDMAAATRVCLRLVERAAAPSAGAFEILASELGFQ
jgi:tripeptide aminopeptidase